MIIAALWVLPCSAQIVETLDSTWISNTGGIFYQNRLITYLNGESTQTKKRLGDTSQVVSQYKTDFINTTQTWANDIEWTSTFTKRVSELIRQDQAMTTSIGKSPVKKIVESYKWMTDSTFRIKDSSKQRPIRFTITPQGQMRYKIDTFQTRSVTLLGNVMRLGNYLNGGSIDLYRFQDDRWRDAARSVQLYLESVGPQNRAKEAPTNSNFADAPVDMPAVMPVTYEGGLVHTSGTWLKYDNRKKKWIPAKPSPGIKPDPR